MVISVNLETYSFIECHKWNNKEAKDIKEATERVAGEGNVKIILTHTPPFSRDMLSEEAKLILGL